MVEEVTCSLWWADLRTAWRPSLARLLDAQEIVRRDRFLRSEDADRFALGAVLLRTAVAAVSGGDPQLVPVDRSCSRCSEPHGRPRLGDGQPFVSVSRSQLVVAVAVCDRAPVGVDVEAVRAVDVAALCPLVVATDELVPRGLDDFFVYWTRKEAFLKATGDGIVQGLTQVTVTPPDRPAAVLTHRGVRPGAGLADVRLAVRGYAAAISILIDATPRVDIRDGAALLARWA